MPRNHQLVDIKPKTLHQTDQNLWIVISKSEFMSNSANITWTMRLKKIYMVNCSKHFNVGQNFKLSNKIPNLTEAIPTSVKPSDISPLQPNISPRPQPTWAHQQGRTRHRTTSETDPEISLTSTRTSPRSPRPRT